MSVEIKALGDVVGSSVGILHKLGLLERIMAKLINSPDQAAAKLDVVFRELQTSYLMLDHALVDICSLEFDAPDDISDQRRFLEFLQGAPFLIEMAKAHGHCHRIGQVYDRYLRGWFGRVLSSDEFAETEALFWEMSGADKLWVSMLENAAKQLQEIGRPILSRLDSDDLEGARRLVEALRDELRSMRRVLARDLQTLFQLQTKFRDLSCAMI